MDIIIVLVIINITLQSKMFCIIKNDSITVYLKNLQLMFSKFIIKVINKFNMFRCDQSFTDKDEKQRRGKNCWLVRKPLGEMKELLTSANKSIHLNIKSLSNINHIFTSCCCCCCHCCC